MAATELPELKELNVQEVNVSSAVLKAATHHYGSQCDKPNKEFMLCRLGGEGPAEMSAGRKEGQRVRTGLLQEGENPLQRALHRVLDMP
ncbi:hypothetical protein scyTo_0003460 [Scyliorhinus torazame]|uniref:Uncharacterized protein n=1 Tax=Scyliorhinus torazame TaxID=75743 RepID=A0A401PMK7_SCYTO|nr:hypothetical protein [Scyliorhinus torazame]